MKNGWWLLVAGLVGCAGRRPPQVDTQVRAVRFEGNGPWLSSRSDAALREAIAHPLPTGAWPLRQTAALDPEVLDDDKRRLAVHYAHHGFFDAQLVRWEVITKRPARDDKPPVVVVVGHVDPGPETAVASTDIDGADELSTPLRRSVTGTLGDLEGERFTLASVDDSVASVRHELGNHAFARAEVRSQVEVDRDEEEAVVRYDVAPGEPATFGEIRVEGGDNVPDRVIDDAIPFDAGDAYRTDDLAEARQRLYGLGAFASVRMMPDRSGDSGPVPVTIELEERRPRSVNAGGGLKLEGGRQEARLRVGAEHVNALDRLLQLEADGSIGYAFLAASLANLQDPSTVRSGPIGEAALAASVPVRSWTARLEAAYDRELTEAFVTDQPSVTPSLTGPLAPDWTLALSYSLTYTTYRDVQVDPEQLRALEQAPDLSDGQYLDTHLEQMLLWDTRNDLLAPTRGFRHSLTLEQAAPFLGGNYDYLGASTDLRTYLPIGRWFGGAPRSLVAALRGGGGIKQPYGAPDRRAVPVAERLYLGGSGSVRGWVYQHLGPYICSLDSDQDCSSALDTAAPDGVDTVPVGGQVSAMGSAELRRHWDQVSAVAFVDAGMVWSDLQRVGEVPILPSVGIGGRLHTPVGPLRLDVAARTDATERFAHEPRLWAHLGLGEAF